MITKKLSVGWFFLKKVILGHPNIYIYTHTRYENSGIFS